MATIGTGTEGNEQAAEERPTDAWRIRHLEVHFENLGSVRIKDRLIESTSLSQDLVGRYVWTQPSAGELLQLSDPFGFPKVQDDLKVTHIIDLDVAAAQEAEANAGVETPAAAEDRAAKEQPGAAPTAEQAAAADGKFTKADKEKMDPLLSAFIDVGLVLTLTGSLKAMEVGLRAFVGTASLIETMGGTAEERAQSYRMMIGRISNYALFSKNASSPAEGSAAHVG